jgi:hypothetical protein
LILTAVNHWILRSDSAQDERRSRPSGQLNHSVRDSCRGPGGIGPKAMPP